MNFSLNDWVVLWSPHQNVFHLETISNMLESNREVFSHKRKGDFIVLDITPTKKMAIESSEVFIRIRNERLLESMGSDSNET